MAERSRKLGFGGRSLILTQDFGGISAGLGLSLRNLGRGLPVSSRVWSQFKEIVKKRSRNLIFGRWVENDDQKNLFLFCFNDFGGLVGRSRFLWWG